MHVTMSPCSRLWVPTLLAARKCNGIGEQLAGWQSRQTGSVGPARSQEELSRPSEGGGPPLLSESFTCSALSMWLTPLDGPTEDWTHIAEVPLLGGCGAPAAT